MHTITSHIIILLQIFLLLRAVSAQPTPKCYNPISTTSPGWIVADGTPYFVAYACGLRSDHVSSVNDSASITFTIDTDGGLCPGSCSNLPYACAEIAAAQRMYLYYLQLSSYTLLASLHGRYEANIQPSGVAGTGMP